MRVTDAEYKKRSIDTLGLSNPPLDLLEVASRACRKHSLHFPLQFSSGAVNLIDAVQTVEPLVVLKT